MLKCLYEKKINKMSIWYNVVYRFGVTPIKMTMAFFTEMKKSNSKFLWSHRRPQIAKAILRKKNKAGHITFLILSYITNL